MFVWKEALTSNQKFLLMKMKSTFIRSDIHVFSFSAFS